MRLISSAILISLLFIGFGQPAHSAQLNPGAEKAIVEHDQTIQELSTLKIRDRLHLAVTDMIATGAQALALRGHSQLATQLEREWQIVGAFLLKNSEALGDHRPMSQWLADAYERMEDVLGSSIMQQLHLNDIYIVNYALPVVVDPRGNWNKREYSRHFIPLAGVATYWPSYVSCVNALGGRRGAIRYCDKVAGILRKGMMSDIAPELSNYVFVKFNKRNTEREFPIGYEQLVRRYGPEIAQIKN